MNKNKGKSLGWIFLPILFSSATVLAGQPSAKAPVTHQQDMNAAEQASALSQSESGFWDEAQETNSLNLNYVGGDTRIGVGFDTEYKGRADVKHTFSSSESSNTRGEAWIGLNPTAESGEDKLTGMGAKINHNWVQSDERGQPSYVHKVFGAYDQNAAKDGKISVGYGQEREDMFWSANVSKGLSDMRLVGETSDTKQLVYEKAYDYGVGGRVGKFFADPLLRVQGGFDYEWGSDYASSEDKPAQMTVTGNVEKFFIDSPHSVGANVEITKAQGGLVGEEKGTDVRGNVNYRYEFGGEGVYQPAERYRRVRVEIPGKTEKIVKKTAPKIERKLVKHTMELEADTFFEKGKAVLSPSAQQRLTGVIARIRDTGYEGNIRITGNTCDLGTTEANQVLSEKRAAAVRAFMAGQGFQQDTLLALGLGETQPKYPNTDESRYRNRRVDIEYVTYENQYTDKVVEAGGEEVRVISQPQVVWRKELIPSPPAWVGQALHNNIQYKQSIDTYRTLGTGAGSFIKDPSNKPVAVVDDKIEVEQGKSVTVDVLANDYDAKKEQIVIVDYEKVSVKGGAVALVNGKLVYTPVADFVGTDSFKYWISNQSGNTAEGTVSVQVAAPFTPTPLAAFDDGKNGEAGYKFYLPDSLYVTKEFTLPVLSNDVGDGLKLVSVDMPPAYGSTRFSDDRQKIIYSARSGYCEDHTFTYTVEDKYGNKATAKVYIDVVETLD